MLNLFRPAAFLAILVLCAVFSSCSHNEQEIIDNTKIAMPDYFRKITGYDSIQLVFGGRGKYNETKKDYDVTWDSLYANFCYPNKWQFEKFKRGTIKISDDSDIETITYYKTLSERLWKATELVQLNTPESNKELARLNQLIVSDRQKHNESVNEAMFSEIKRVVSK